MNGVAETQPNSDVVANAASTLISGTAPAAEPTNVTPAPAVPATAEPAPANPAPAPADTGFGGQAMPQENTGFGGQALDTAPSGPPAAVDPASYTNFTLPAHINMANPETVATMDAFKQMAGRRGMSQEVAQSTLDLMHELDGWVSKGSEERLAAQKQEWETESHQKGLLTRDSIDAANSALKALDPKGDLTQFLNETGLTAHPALIQAFAAFSRFRQQPAILTGFQGGGTGGHSQPETLGSILFDKS